jgi:DNA-binding transcriptional MerR regulator
MLKIGDFSRLCRVTVKALRYYDEIGLLKPAYISPESGYRYYKPEQLNTISEILLFKEMGFSLEEIEALIHYPPSPEAMRRKILKRKSQIETDIQAERKKLIKLDDFLNQMEEKNMKVELKKLPEVIVASLRTVISDYDALFEVAPAMGEKMKAHGAVCREPAYCFNIYHDGEYREKDVDVEICEAVTDFLPDADGIRYKKIPAVQTAACLLHRGSYSTLGKSYARILQWIEENGYTILDHPRESYIDGCWNQENPELWLTEIQIPVEKN